MALRTVIEKISPTSPEARIVRMAADIILRGGLVVFPTETVYGLGADALNSRAVKKIFIVKRRPPDNPLIVHIAEVETLHEVAINIPERAFKLIEKAWPGPVTLILRKSEKIPKEVTGGLNTVAVRMPGHPVALEIIKVSGKPIAAPSANISGRPSPTSAQHVIMDLMGKVDLILDAGETFFGVESTVVDILADPPVLLRPGPIDIETLEAILKEKVIIPDWVRGLSNAAVALSPGMKYKHYSPAVPLILVESLKNNVSDVFNKILEIVNIERNRRIVVIASTETSKLYEARGIETLQIGSRENLYEVARNLYSVLRVVDNLGVDIAICEGFEERGIGLAIMNRLRKAATKVYRV